MGGIRTDEIRIQTDWNLKMVYVSSPFVSLHYSNLDRLEFKDTWIAYASDDKGTFEFRQTGI